MKRLKKIGKWMMIVMLSLITMLFGSACVFMQHPKFGSNPSGARLERIQKSPHYKEGKFQNDTQTPTFAEGYTFWGELKKSVFVKHPHVVPEETIPSVKTDLIHLPVDSTAVVWFGHSSCLIQINGKRILVDPVFNENASPVPGSVKAFKGTTIYSVSDLPEIDYLLITHDHYDHLDYETALALRDKTKKVVCGLGVGAHVVFDEQFLKDFKVKHHLSDATSDSNDAFLRIKKSELIPNFIHSLAPYYSNTGKIDDTFSNVKREELLLFLLKQTWNSGAFFLISVFRKKLTWKNL